MTFSSNLHWPFHCAFAHIAFIHLRTTLWDQRLKTLLKNPDFNPGHNQFLIRMKSKELSSGFKANQDRFMKRSTLTFSGIICDCSSQWGRHSEKLFSLVDKLVMTPTSPDIFFQEKSLVDNVRALTLIFNARS